MTIARDLYRQAIAADSGFGLAWAGLAEASLYLQWRDPSDRQSRELARRAAENAVMLAPAAAEAHLALGRVRDELEHDNAGATSQYETALRLQPGNAEVLHVIAIDPDPPGAARSRLRARAAQHDLRRP